MVFLNVRYDKGTDGFSKSKFWVDFSNDESWPPSGFYIVQPSSRNFLTFANQQDWCCEEIPFILFCSMVRESSAVNTLNGRCYYTCLLIRPTTLRLDTLPMLWLALKEELTRPSTFPISFTLKLLLYLRNYLKPFDLRSWQSFVDYGETNLSPMGSLWRSSDVVLNIIILKTVIFQEIF